MVMLKCKNDDTYACANVDKMLTLINVLLYIYIYNMSLLKYNTHIFHYLKYIQNCVTC